MENSSISTLEGFIPKTTYLKAVTPSGFTVFIRVSWDIEINNWMLCLVYPDEIVFDKKTPFASLCGTLSVNGCQVSTKEEFQSEFIKIRKKQTIAMS